MFLNSLSTPCLSTFLIAVALTSSWANTDVSVQSLCKDYAQKKSHNNYVDIINTTCAAYTEDKFKDKEERPSYNFRSTLGLKSGQDEKSCKLFRSGQPGPKNPEELGLKSFPSRFTGFSLDKARSDYQIDYIFSLRFDRTNEELPFSKLYATTLPQLPVSSGEVSYSYAEEKKLVEAYKMKSIYAPTVPEMEHFIGNYVPRLDEGPNAKPYFCRLPKNIADGAKTHWVDQALVYTTEALKEGDSGSTGPLVSAYEDCRDLKVKFGADLVEEWLEEVKSMAHLGNQVFLQVVRLIEKVNSQGDKVLYHCAGGTDRVGRISLILEARNYKLRKRELEKYSGPGSNAKIDLILLNYLLSSRAGTSPKYKYFFPDENNPLRSYLGLALEPLDKRIPLPYFTNLRK